jgi:hypothetical protein
MFRLLSKVFLRFGHRSETLAIFSILNNDFALFLMKIVEKARAPHNSAYSSPSLIFHGHRRESRGVKIVDRILFFL